MNLPNIVHDELGSDGRMHRVITNPNAMAKAIVKMNFSNEYAALQHQFHIDRPDYGMSGMKYAEHILQLANKLKTRDILDYGCGKATLQKSLPFPIQNYDPFIDEYKQSPVPAQLVVCTDVMEHIEIEYLDNVLEDIRDLTTKLAFFQIATRPAAKFLPDGRNAHLIQENVNWWLKQLMPFFNIHHLEDLGGGFIAVCSPNPDWSPAC
jgi:hypothetical protein